MVRCEDCVECAWLGDGTPICLVKSTKKKLYILPFTDREIECMDFTSIDAVDEELEELENLEGLTWEDVFEDDEENHEGEEEEK